MNMPAASRLISLLLLLCLASCASPGNPQVHAARGKFQTRRTYTQGIVGGAIAGAALGALVTAAQGGNSDSILRGALIGGGTGAVGGGIYAHNVVQQRRAYAAREGALDRAIANASSTKQAASEFNDVLASQLAKERASSKTRAGTIVEATAVLNGINREISRQKQTLASASAQGLSRLDQQRLQNEIYGLESERRQLQSQIDTLSTASPGTPVAGAR